MRQFIQYFTVAATITLTVVVVITTAVIETIVTLMKKTVHKVFYSSSYNYSNNNSFVMTATNVKMYENRSHYRIKNAITTGTITTMLVLVIVLTTLVKV